MSIVLEGTIVFSSGKLGDFDIWSLDLDTAEMMQLTEGECQNDQPKWSPDGSQIVFVSDRSGYTELWLMNEDGSDQKQLTDTKKFHSGPSWSNDGKEIVYCANYDGGDDIEVWSIPAQGGEPRKVLSYRGTESNPMYSSDGKKILLASDRTGNDDIWEYDIETGSWLQLTFHEANDFAPVYSPDETKIAFVSERDPKDHTSRKRTDIWLMNRDGSQKEMLTFNNESDRYIAWSPFGDALVVCSGCNPSGASGGERLHIISVDGFESVDLKGDRAILEEEIDTELYQPALQKILQPLLTKLGLHPEKLTRKFYDHSYFGTEKNPDWKM